MENKELHAASVDLSHVRALIASVARRLVNGHADAVTELEALLVAEEAAKCHFTVLARAQEEQNG